MKGMGKEGGKGRGGERIGEKGGGTHCRNTLDVYSARFKCCPAPSERKAGAPDLSSLPAA